MPGGDMTGPLGLGHGNWGYGRGYCYRWRRGFRGGRFIAAEPLTLTKEEQKKVLEAEKEELKADLKRIEEKLNEL